MRIHFADGWSCFALGQVSVLLYLVQLADGTAAPLPPFDVEGLRDGLAAVMLPNQHLQMAARLHPARPIR